MTQELTTDLVQFYRDYYEEEIAKLAQRYPKDQKSLWIDWMDIFRYDSAIADDIKKKPDQMLEYFEEALRQYDLPLDISFADANVRITNLPDSEVLSVADTRSDHVNTYIGVAGQVSKTSDVKPRPIEVAFECQRCGTLTRIPQSGTEFQEPHECQGCERQGPFRMNVEQSTLTDHQLVRLQEPPEQSKGGNGKHIDVMLEDDLVNSVSPGDRVEVAGTLSLDEDTDGMTFDTYLDGQATAVEETDFEEIDVSEYEDEIYAIANGEYGDPFEALVGSIAPKIRGYEDIKTGLVLQLFGGVRVQYPDGSADRGDFHILLLGDPGCGKSTLLRAIEQIAPRSTYVSGKGASKAGMTAAAVRDDFGDTEWGLEAGALVMADQGVACVDEIDKVQDDAVSSLHGALESQRVEIQKAGIDATLPARTALLAGGNPKYGRFDMYEPIGQQIDLGPTLLSRFDLMFMLTDEPDEQKDSEIARHMINSRRMANDYTHGTGTTDDMGDIEPTIDRETLRAYIAYAKQNIHPVIPDEVASKIEDWYTNFRMANSGDNDSPVPVTARKIEAIERLSEASARARLSDTVEKEDVERAGRLVMRSMRDVGVDPETGEFDADVVETGQSKAQRDRIQNVKSIIEELQSESKKGAGHEIVVDEAMEHGIDREQTEHEIQKLKDKGEIYEQHTDYYRTT